MNKIKIIIVYLSRGLIETKRNNNNIVVAKIIIIVYVMCREFAKMSLSIISYDVKTRILKFPSFSQFTSVERRLIVNNLFETNVICQMYTYLLLWLRVRRWWEFSQRLKTKKIATRSNYFKPSTLERYSMYLKLHKYVL